MILLGSTGSIGTNTLEIARRFDLKVEALSANKNVSLLNRQIAEFKPKYVAIIDENLKNKINHDNVFVGEDGILKMLEICHENLVINALVGFAGLKPSLKTQILGKKLALANKESLVVGGKFLDTKSIIPIDSEHFGLKYLLHDKMRDFFSKNASQENLNPSQNLTPLKLTITASGGAFRDTPLEKISSMNFQDALKHPNWQMGAKITIDSATMVNKIFELLEAKWLFNALSYDAIIEPKSIIHAFVDFVDGSTTAHFANADMKLPIAYALLGEVKTPILPHVDLLKIANLEFRKIEKNRYPIWEIKDFVLQNPHFGVVINAANEVAIERFMQNKINAFDIAKTIKNALKKFDNIALNSPEDIFAIDLEVRNFLKVM